MSAKRKQGAVWRLLRGEDLELVLRERAVPAAEVSAWRDAFLAAGEAALKTRPADGRNAEIGRSSSRSITARRNASASTPPAGGAAPRRPRWSSLGARRPLRGARAAAPSCAGLLRRFGLDAGVAGGLELRHDHGSQFVADEYQRALAFLGLASSPAFVREPAGNGCVERFIRTLKESLLWVRRFATIEELRLALHAFKETYNQAWTVERHGYQTPATVRATQLAPLHAAA